MIQFNATYLAALMPFRARNDVRHYLAGIHVAPHPSGGAVLAATDGHRLMCIYDADAYCSDAVTFIIGNDAAKYCARRPGQPAALVTINPITQRLTIAGGSPARELYVQPGKCLMETDAAPGRWTSFPDWRRVIPSVTDLKPGFANLAQAAYLEQAAKAHPLRGARRDAPAMRFWQVEANQAIVVEYEGAPEYMLIIMPYGRERTTDTPNAAPLWKKAFRKAPPAAADCDAVKLAA